VWVDGVDVAIVACEFTATSASFTVPSWAPGSSPVLARWACRLVVERGADVHTPRPDGHAREIADASATWSSVGRTPV
jgi:hypothetical protein